MYLAQLAERAGCLEKSSPARPIESLFTTTSLVLASSRIKPSAGNNQPDTDADLVLEEHQADSDRLAAVELPRHALLLPASHLIRRRFCFVHYVNGLWPRIDGKHRWPQCFVPIISALKARSATGRRNEVICMNDDWRGPMVKFAHAENKKEKQGKWSWRMGPAS
jgi:hypothetical protein